MTTPLCAPSHYQADTREITPKSEKDWMEAQQILREAKLSGHRVRIIIEKNIAPDDPAEID